MQKIKPTHPSKDKERGNKMPKFKGKSGAKKRFKTTATGLLKREKAYRSHILTKKSTKRKRSLRQATLVDATQQKRIKTLILAK